MAWGGTSRFDSGLPSRFTADEPPAARADEETAVREFVEANWGHEDRSFRWELARIDRDLTHAHHLFRLLYENRVVLDHLLKVHYRRDGWVEYASSSWERPFRLDLPASSRSAELAVDSAVRRHLLRERGIREVDVTGEAVVWVTASGRAVAGRDVWASSRRHGYFGRLVVDESTGAVLAEPKAVRSIDQSNKVYKNSGLGSPAFDAVTLTGLASAASLLSSQIHVLREENEASPRDIEISSSTVFADDAVFSTAPGSYNAACGSDADAANKNNPAKCPNAGFDGVNVFYQIQEYRTRLAELLASIGSSPAVLRNDPLPIFMNAFVDTDGDGSNDTNNALYVPGSCGSVAPKGCIVFVRPEAGKLSTCGSGTITFFDPAREAVVLVHEYQHYVTDMISGMLSSSKGVVVADLLHEGYSDYFGASQVSRLNAKSVTLVGEYFLQQCVPLQRQIGTVKVFENNAADKDPHYAGISWASGLWELRNQLGVDAADKLALKSLFFMPTQPNTFDAVEALVKADRALNGGTNVGMIRALYYNRILFLGGSPPPFDPVTKLINVGFTGCSSVPLPGSAGGTAVTFGLWLLGTLWAGVARRRKRGGRA